MTQTDLTAAEIFQSVTDLYNLAVTRGIKAEYISVEMAMRLSFIGGAKPGWQSTFWHKSASDASCACNRPDIHKYFEGVTAREAAEQVRDYINGLEVWSQADIAATLGIEAMQ